MSPKLFKNTTNSFFSKNINDKVKFDVFTALRILNISKKYSWPLNRNKPKNNIYFNTINPTIQAILLFFDFFLIFFFWNKARVMYYINNWVYTTNHKRIAINYFWFVILSGIVGMVLATVIRLEFAYPGVGIFAGDSIQYLSLASAHGVIMVFFMIMPLMFGAFANFLLPTQLGVHDVAFPRLNSAAFWFLPGGLLMLCQLVCVDRRYQRMNCFNIREVQSLLKRKFFTDLINSKDHHELLNSTAMSTRFKTNNINAINGNLLLSYTYGLDITPKIKISSYVPNIEQTSLFSAFIKIYNGNDLFYLLVNKFLSFNFFFYFNSFWINFLYNNLFFSNYNYFFVNFYKNLSIIFVTTESIFKTLFNKIFSFFHLFLDIPNLLENFFKIFSFFLNYFINLFKFENITIIKKNLFFFFSYEKLNLFIENIKKKFDNNFLTKNYFVSSETIKISREQGSFYDFLFFNEIIKSFIYFVINFFNAIFTNSMFNYTNKIINDFFYLLKYLIISNNNVWFNAQDTWSFVLSLVSNKFFEFKVNISQNTNVSEEIKEINPFSPKKNEKIGILIENINSPVKEFYIILYSFSNFIVQLFNFKGDLNIITFPELISYYLNNISHYYNLNFTDNNFFAYFFKKSSIFPQTPKFTLELSKDLMNNVYVLFFQNKFNLFMDTYWSKNIFFSNINKSDKWFYNFFYFFKYFFINFFFTIIQIFNIFIINFFFFIKEIIIVFKLIFFDNQTFLIFKYIYDLFLSNDFYNKNNKNLQEKTIMFKSNYFLDINNKDIFLLSNEELKESSRNLKFDNPVFKYDYKSGDYFPKLYKEVYTYLFSSIIDLTSGLRTSPWFFSANMEEMININFSNFFNNINKTLTFKNFEIHSWNLNKFNHTDGFYNFFFLLKNNLNNSNFKYISSNSLSNKFQKMFLTSSLQQRVYSNWKQLKFTREAWRCKLLSARHQKTLFRRYVNEDGVFWSIERNAKDLIPGWAMITPFSSRTRFTAIGKTDIGLMGVLLVLNSSIISSANFLVTYRYLSTLNNRKMRDARAFFTESIMVSSWMMILANPMLVIGIIMLLSDRHWQTSFFDYSGGGDTVLFQHMFWFFGHPEVYIIIIPTFGFTNTIISYYLKKRVSARASLLYSMYTIAFLGFFVWGHHMYMVGLAHTTRMLFSTLTVMISVPAATKIMHWCVTTVNSSFMMELPLLFTFTFVFFFVSGGISGMCVAHTGMDILFHDTFYVIGHFHVMLAGAAMFASFGAFYFYFPAIFGVKYSRVYAYLHYTYYLIGQLMTLIPMFWLGYAGMPRRVLDYPASFGGWHSVISAGHMLNVAGLMAFFFMIFDSLRQSRAATRNTFGISRFNTRLNFYIYEIARSIFLQQKTLFLYRYVQPQSLKLLTVNYTNYEPLETTLITYKFLKKNWKQ